MLREKFGWKDSVLFCEFSLAKVSGKYHMPNLRFNDDV